MQLLMIIVTSWIATVSGGGRNTLSMNSANLVSWSISRAPSCGFPSPKQFFLLFFFKPHYHIISSKGLSALGFRSRHFGRWRGNSCHNINLDSSFFLALSHYRLYILLLNVLSFFPPARTLSYKLFYCQTEHSTC